MPVGINGNGTLSGVSPVLSGFGKVLQVVETRSSTQVNNTTETYVDLLSLSITPSSTSSKIYTIAYATVGGFGGTYAYTSVAIFRGATLLKASSVGAKGPSEVYDTVYLPVYDSPATTSSTTYTLNFCKGIGSATSSSAYDYSLTLMEIAA